MLPLGLRDGRREEWGELLASDELRGWSLIDGEDWYCRLDEGEGSAA